MDLKEIKTGTDIIYLAKDQNVSEKDQLELIKISQKWLKSIEWSMRWWKALVTYKLE